MQEYYFSVNYIDVKIIEDEFPDVVTYQKDHIPVTATDDRRSGKKTIHRTITIHNSNNPSSTAKNERDWLVNEANRDKDSFHIFIDDMGAIEAIPLDEVANHFYIDGQIEQPSESSIGIVICESGQYEMTLTNAAQIVADLLYDRDWGVDRLRRHFDFTGKNCPRKMNADGMWSGWYSFVSDVNQKLAELNSKEKQLILDEDLDNETEQQPYTNNSSNIEQINNIMLIVEDLLKIIQQLEHSASKAKSKQEKDEWLRLANVITKLIEQKFY